MRSAQAQPAKNQNFWKQIQKYDRQVDQGHVVYRRNIAEGGKSQVYKYDLRYDAKSRYAEQLVLPGANGIPTKTVFDGQDSFQVNGDTIVITAGLPFKLDLTSYWALGVCAKPSLPLGRGLSQLKNPQLTWNGAIATVKGAVSDGTVLIAQVDTKDHFLVRSARRMMKNGRLISTTTNTGISRDGLVVTKSVLKLPNVSETTTFVSTNFTAQPESAFHVPLKGRLKILDQRLGITPVNFKTSDGEISKNELLIHTRALLQDKKQKQARTVEAEKKQSLVNASVLAAPALLCLSWFMILKAKKKRLEV